MNFLDPYEVTGSTTPVANQPEQSLDEELTQVVGQLSKFWGGFRKQSQTAFETARKDLSQVVSQAQKELGKLTSEDATQTRNTESSADQPEAGPSKAPASDEAPASASEAEANTEPATSPTAPATSIFSRLQASLPPTLVSSVQTTVQAQLPVLKNAHARANSLSAALSAELHKVQTGEFVARSEELLREAGDFLREAVRVIPPEEQGADGSYIGMAWDGTDVWMLPGVGEGAGKGKEREREGSGSRRQSGEGLRTGATRAEALLKQLRHDPEVIKADPAADPHVRDMYASWVKDEVDTKEGGIRGEEWADAIGKALSDSVDGAALAATRDALVPSDITNEVFWTRYFFRVHQVEREEEKRKALFQGTTENEEDFSWEDDDEDAPSHAPTGPTTSEAVTSTIPTASLHLATSNSTLALPTRTSTPGNASPRRQSSEDSYDVVSSQASHNGGGADTKGDTTPISEVSKEKEDEDEADSDWE